MASVTGMSKFQNVSLLRSLPHDYRITAWPTFCRLLLISTKTPESFRFKYQ